LYWLAVDRVERVVQAAILFVAAIHFVIWRQVFSQNITILLEINNSRVQNINPNGFEKTWKMKVLKKMFRPDFLVYACSKNKNLCVCSIYTLSCNILKNRFSTLKTLSAYFKNLFDTLFFYWLAHSKILI
jgi:hypothetical protein